MVAPQWRPSHCAIPGNERVIYSGKRGNNTVRKKNTYTIIFPEIKTMIKETKLK